MSASEPVWHHVFQLSESLDGDREVSEQMLNRLERQLNAMPRNERDEVRRQMILIVAGLSRLEVRLIESDGPVQTAV